jgi:TonB family protein
MNGAFSNYWHGREDPRFLLEIRDPEQRPRRFVAGAGAIFIQAALVLFALNAPSGAVGSREGTRIVPDFRNSTPLIAPPADLFKLTQKEPQRGKPAAEVDLAALQPKQALVAPKLAPQGRFVPSDPGPSAQQLVEAPKIELPAQSLPNSALPQNRLPSAPPPAEQPKLAFERVGSPSPASPAQGQPTLAPPKAGVEEAIRAVARSGGRQAVSDSGGEGAGGISEAARQGASPGRRAGTLELLSDPQGVDFRPYLVQVLAAVKRNWAAVLPESARFGQQGRTAIQFSISRAGSVPKLVIAVPSGTEALDRAAVAGISASNPFPPLPAEFRGTEIRLQLLFSYNMPRQ